MLPRGYGDLHGNSDPVRVRGTRSCGATLTNQTGQRHAGHYDLGMSELVQLGSGPGAVGAPSCAPARPPRIVFRLQVVTLVWMLVECGVSIYAAKAAHSAALLAFGSDSLVELLSASLVLAQCIPGFSIDERRVNRVAGGLLFLLAVMVAAAAIAALVLRVKPETSGIGMAITVAALVAMPVLAWLKRREARRTGNTALAADAVQSAACAYLALVTLVGLAANAIFHIAWMDGLAALAAVPILIKEGRSAWRGQGCACC
jgi:divalent metal cation (Fe/Co/Zn/Cd) transporter